MRISVLPPLAHLSCTNIPSVEAKQCPPTCLLSLTLNTVFPLRVSAYGDLLPMLQLAKADHVPNSVFSRYLCLVLLD